MIGVLGSLAEVKSGHPFRGSVPLSGDGNAFVLQMRDLTDDGDVRWDALVRTQLDERKEIQWLRQGDIVFVARGARNHAVCLQEVPKPVVCSQYFFVLRPTSPDLLPEFLAWQINRAPTQRFLATNAEGSDQLSIRRGVLEAMPIAVPPLQKQHLIVALAEAAKHEKQQLEFLIRNRQQQLDALAFALAGAESIEG